MQRKVSSCAKTFFFFLNSCYKHEHSWYYIIVKQIQISYLADHTLNCATDHRLWVEVFFCEMLERCDFPNERSVFTDYTYYSSN